jgi:hypothetical protein
MALIDPLALLRCDLALLRTSEKDYSVFLHMTVIGDITRQHFADHSLAWSWKVTGLRVEGRHDGFMSGGGETLKLAKARMRQGVDAFLGSCIREGVDIEWSGLMPKPASTPQNQPRSAVDGR